MWSPDGTQIAFVSKATNLVPEDTHPMSDVFVKTLDTGAIRLISTDADGTKANWSSEPPVWSPDGTQIAFVSQADNLVDADTNGASDVFVKTLGDGTIRRVSVAANGIQANKLSDTPAWSPDGTQIAFVSEASNLVDDDTNDYPDLFVKTLG